MDVEEAEALSNDKVPHEDKVSCQIVCRAHFITSPLVWKASGCQSL